jgi:hypothetical protein
MAPPTSVAPRLPSKAAPRPEPSRPRRPPLRILEPPRRRRRTSPSVRRWTVWISAALVVGSLLAVVVGDAVVSEGQVRLTATQSQLAAAAFTQKGLQVSVAEKAAPPVVVAQAKKAGLTAPPVVVTLPHVPLNVPLPVPQTAPLPGQAPSGASPASTAATSAPAGQ